MPVRMARWGRVGVVGALALGLGSGPALGQGPGDPDVRLGLRGAAELALQGADPAGPAIADWRIREERGRLWPTVTLQGRISNESLDNTSTTTQSQFGISGTIGRYGGDVVVSTNLLQFLETRPRIEAAQAEERVARLRLTQEQHERVLQTVDAYLTLAAERETLGALDALRGEQREALRRQEERLERDAIPMIEVVRARGEVLALDREVLTSRQRAAVAELRLRKLTGLSPQQRIALAFSPEQIDLGFIDAEGLEGLLGLAREGNPRLQAARAGVDRARAEAEVVESLKYPSLSLYGSVGYGHVSESNGGSFSRTGARHAVFLTLGIPLFDGGVRQAQIAQADLRVKSRAHDSRQTAEDVKTQVEQAYWAYRERQDTGELIARQVELAQEELYQATARSDGGVAPGGEPLGVLSKLARLRAELARARAEAHVRGIAVALAAGRNFLSESGASITPRPGAPGPPAPAAPERVPTREATAPSAPADDLVMTIRPGR